MEKLVTMSIAEYDKMNSHIKDMEVKLKNLEDGETVMIYNYGRISYHPKAKIENALALQLEKDKKDFQNYKEKFEISIKNRDYISLKEKISSLQYDIGTLESESMDLKAEIQILKEKLKVKDSLVNRIINIFKPV